MTQWMNKCENTVQNSVSLGLAKPGYTKPFSNFLGFSFCFSM